MRRSIMFIVVFALLVLAAAGDAHAVSAENVKKASKAYAKGEKAFRAGDMEKASAAFEQALAIADGFPEANIGLGHIAMSEKRFDDALARYERARDGYAEIGDAMMDLRLKRYNDTRTQIQHLRDQQREFESRVSSGGSEGTNANLRISQINNQIAQLSAIEAPDVEEATEAPGEIFFNIGNALFQLQRLDEAIAAWETCREKSPAFAMVYNNLALAYMHKGQFQKAMGQLAKAEELGFPVNPQFKADLQARAGQG